jgi:hypothetical protein
MTIDIQTALKFIETNFANYTNKDFIQYGKNTYKFNKHDWYCTNVHVNSEIKHDYEDVLDMNKVCIWNHHNLYDETTIQKINKRSKHLLYVLNKNPKTMLLFYIEKIQKYGEKDNYFDKNILNKFNCNFLILIPLLNFNQEPFLFYSDNQTNIIYFNSNLELYGTEITSHVEEWEKLKILINSLYDFDIDERNEEIF